MGEIYKLSKDSKRYYAHNVKTGVVQYANTDLNTILLNLVAPDIGNATIIVIDESLKLSVER
jgi:hypothetical protein